MNVYAIDVDGKVHDVAYDLDAKTAKAMASSLNGGVAMADHPDSRVVSRLASNERIRLAEKKPKREDG